MKALSKEQQLQLRSKGLLLENEIAFLEGDLLVAENVLNKQRRLIEGAEQFFIESNKRILKG